MTWRTVVMQLSNEWQYTSTFLLYMNAVLKLGFYGDTSDATPE